VIWTQDEAVNEQLEISADLAHDVVVVENAPSLLQGPRRSDVGD
jgi:hypothetical protein